MLNNKPIQYSITFAIMKLCIFVIAAFLLAVTFASPAKESRLGTPSPAFQKKECAKACPADYKPVCGSDGKDKKSFGNECVMNNYNCEHGTKLTKIGDKECPGGGGVRLS